MNLVELKRVVKLVDGVLYRKYRNKAGYEWRPFLGQDEKYGVININGVNYSVHRVVWALANNREPRKVIDHIDGNPANNHPNNLREVTQRDNTNNKESHRKGRLPGAFSSRGKYSCSLYVCGFGNVFIGRFDTAEESSLFYKQAVKNLDQFNGDPEAYRALLYTKLNKSRRDSKGCKYNKNRNKWIASINVNKTAVHLGCFSSEEEAVEFYKLAKTLTEYYESPPQFRELVQSALDSNKF